MSFACVVYGLLTVGMFALFCYLLPSKLSPTEAWQRTYAPWFGMPAKVIDLDKKTHLYLQDYTVESHYLLELSEKQLESWRGCLKDAGVEVEDDALGFSCSFLFALNAPDNKIKVNDFNLQRQEGAAPAGYAIYALDIEYGDWDAEDIPHVELLYPEYAKPLSTAPLRMDFVCFFLPFMMSISLLLFIWPSVWRDSLGKMVLKSAPFCSVISFIIIIAGAFEDPLSNLGFLYFFFFCYVMELTIIFTLLASLVCALRWLYTRCRRKV